MCRHVGHNLVDSMQFQSGGSRSDPAHVTSDDEIGAIASDSGFRTSLPLTTSPRDRSGT